MPSTKRWAPHHAPGQLKLNVNSVNTDSIIDSWNYNKVDHKINVTRAYFCVNQKKSYVYELIINQETGNNV